MGFLIEGEITKLLTTLNLIIGECPTHMNGAFLGILYYKKRTQEKENCRKRR